MRTLAGYETFDRAANRPALELADRVAELAPMEGAAVFFASGGSDAVDTASKLALRYWSAVGRPEKHVIVHRARSYHGMNAYGTSLAGIPANAEGYGSLIADVATVAQDSTDELEQLFGRAATRIAAFIGEPVIGAGGIFHPVPGYWERVQELCAEHDVLLIADEVICGFGRLGTWFGSHRFGIEPDLVTCAKGITSGYLPLGAVLASRADPGAVLVVARRGRLPPWLHVLRPPRGLRRRPGQPRHHRARGAGRPGRRAWSPCWRMRSSRCARRRWSRTSAPGSACWRPSRSTPTRAQPSPGWSTASWPSAATLGVMTRGLAGHSLQLSPPFVITEDELATVASVIADALSRVSVRASV